jgi:uncharacterized protein (TIGR03085 family)
MSSQAIILSERQFFVETLKGLKPAEWRTSTLCAGWNVEDLAAHLIVRERGGLVARLGIVLPFLHHKHDASIRKTKQKSHNELIKILAEPPFWVKRFPFNVIEFFVHNEDLLRGELKRKRVLSDELEQALSGYVPQLMRLAFRKVSGGFDLVVHDETVGAVYRRHFGSVAESMPELELTATAGELVLLFAGRGRHAKVRVSGSAEAKRLYAIADIGL